MRVHEVVSRAADEQVRSRGCGMNQHQVAGCGPSRNVLPTALRGKPYPSLDRSVCQPVSFRDRWLAPDRPQASGYQSDAVETQIGVASMKPEARSDQALGRMGEPFAVGQTEELVG